MNRRRLLISSGKGKYIDNGLVVWYDGKNNLKGGGYSTTTNIWYPYVAENSNILNYCYLYKSGRPTWLTNGGFNDPSSSSSDCYGQTTSSGVFTTRTTAITDFTWIIHVNVKKSDLTAVFCLLGQTYSGGSGTGRYQLTCKEYGRIFTMNQNTGTGWIECKVSGNIPDIIRTVAFVRSGSTLTVYINGQLFGSNTGCSTAALIRNDNAEFHMASYDGAWDEFNGDFYGCVCYRRALSATEVKDMTDYLEYRYTTGGGKLTLFKRILSLFKSLVKKGGEVC